MKKRVKGRPGRPVLCSILAAAAGVLASESPLRATQTVSTWKSGVSGNWTTTSNWSSQPFFPGNGYPIASTTYAAVINAAGNYTVSLNYNTDKNSHAITIDSLLLNSAGATFNQSGSTLTSGLTNISAGTYLLSGGGTLTGGLLSVASTAQANVSNGTFSNMNLANGTVVNIAGNLPGNVLNITNGLQAAGTGTISMSRFNQPAYYAYYQGTVQFSGNESVNGIGINCNNGTGALNSSAGTLTLGARSSISSIMNSGMNINLSSLVNAGSISASGNSYLYINGSQMNSSGNISATNYSNLTIQTSNWNNTGTISIDGSSTISLLGNWQNTGTIQGAAGGTIILGGQFTAAGIGALNPNGAALQIGGLNNTGNNLSYPTAASLTINGPVTGGTITPPAGQPLYLSNGTLSGVVVAGDLSATGGTIAPGTVVSTGNFNISGNLTFSGVQTLDNANIQLPTGSSITGGTSAADVFTLGAHTLVNVTGEPYNGAGSFTGPGSIINNGSINLLSAQDAYNPNLDASFSANSASFTNNGTISSQGSSVLTLQGNWANPGTISLGTGSRVILQGTFASSSVTNISLPGGQLTIDGAMDNSNSTFVIDSSKGSSVNINGFSSLGFGIDPGGSITGGAVEIASGETLALSGGLNTALTVDANATLTTAPTFSNDDGAGPIIIAGPTLVNRGTLAGGNGSLIVNSDSFTNYGMMNSSGSYQSYIQINSTNWNNSGNIVTGQYQSTVLRGNWANTGTINSQTLDLGGTFATASLAGITSLNTTISGTMDNTNANFKVDGSLGSLELSGTINGGSVEVMAGQSLYTNGNISNATVTVDAGATLTGGTLSGPLFTNHGTLSDLFTTVTINSAKFINDGTINTANGTLTVSGTLDVGQGILVTGGIFDLEDLGLNSGGSIVTTSLIFDNDPSTLIVDLAYQSQLSLDVTGNVILGGNLEISSEIDSEIDGTFTNDVLTVDPGYSMTGSFLNVPSGGRLEADDGSGSFEVDYGGSTYGNEVVLSILWPVPSPNRRA